MYSRKTADLRRFTPSPGNSSIWRAQETAAFRRKPRIFAESHRKPQIGLRHLRCVTFSSALFQKNPRAHKNKSALPPPKKNPKYPPLKGGILWTWFFLQKERIFPGAHKIGAAISGPRIADKNFTDTRIQLSKNSGVFLATSAQNQLKLAQDLLKSATLGQKSVQNWRKSAKIG